MSRYTGLGFDPTPGTVDSVRALADALADAARAIDDAAGRITHAVTTSDAWQGTAADEFRRSGTALPERLESDRRTMTDAADALFAWATTLADLQRQAEQHDRRARGLVTRIAEAQQLVEEWEIAVSVASTHVRPQAEATLAGHRQALTALRAELDSVRAAARALGTEHQAAAAATASRLHGPAGRPLLVTDIGARLADLSALTRRAGVVAFGASAGRPDIPTGAAAVALRSAT